LVILSCFVGVFATSFGQNNSENNQADATIFTEFNAFFDKQIKYQGIKGDWIFKLNEITGLHKFDFNNDGYQDVLIEFNAVPVEGGGVTYFYAVLFENEQNMNYTFINYLESDNLIFKEYNDDYYVFFNRRTNANKNFKLINFKFVQIL
jgi:hypothetical protein